MTGMDFVRFELGGTKDSGDLQLVAGNGLPGEEFKDLHRVGIHGLASHAPKGSHGTALALHGRRDRALIIGLEHQQKRPRDLPEGATALYDANGNILKLVGDSGLLDLASRPFTIKCGTLTVEATEVIMKAGATVVRLRNGRIDLGAMIAPAKVMTEAGPSSVVYAVP